MTALRAARAPAPQHRSRRPAVTVIGVVLAVVGVLAGTGAAGVLVAFGSDSTLDVGPLSLSTPSAAVVSDVAQLEDVAGLATVTGWPRLQASVTPDGPAGAVFVGIGPSAAVDRYLDGVAHDVVADLTAPSSEVRTSARPGSVPAAPPATQTFWVAAAGSSSAPDLSWDVQDGDYRLVVMNADGSAGVSARADLRLVLGSAFPVALGVLAAGCLVALVGVALAVRAVVAAHRA